MRNFEIFESWNRVISLARTETLNKRAVGNKNSESRLKILCVCLPHTTINYDCHYP